MFAFLVSSPPYYASLALSYTELNLSFNRLSGTVPPIGPAQLMNFTDLYLNFNDLTGGVPDSVCDLFRRGSLIELFADCDAAATAADAADATDEGGAEIVCDCCTECFRGDP